MLALRLVKKCQAGVWLEGTKSFRRFAAILLLMNFRTQIEFWQVYKTRKQREVPVGLAVVHSYLENFGCLPAKVENF